MSDVLYAISGNETDNRIDKPRWHNLSSLGTGTAIQSVKVPKRLFGLIERKRDNKVARFFGVGVEMS